MCYRCVNVQLAPGTECTPQCAEGSWHDPCFCEHTCEPSIGKHIGRCLHELNSDVFPDGEPINCSIRCLKPVSQTNGPMLGCSACYTVPFDCFAPCVQILDFLTYAKAVLTRLKPVGQRIVDAARTKLEAHLRSMAKDAACPAQITDACVRAGFDIWSPDITRAVKDICNYYLLDVWPAEREMLMEALWSPLVESREAEQEMLEQEMLEQLFPEEDWSSLTHDVGTRSREALDRERYDELQMITCAFLTHPGFADAGMSSSSCDIFLHEELPHRGGAPRGFTRMMRLLAADPELLDIFLMANTVLEAIRERIKTSLRGTDLIPLGEKEYTRRRMDALTDVLWPAISAGCRDAVKDLDLEKRRRERQRRDEAEAEKKKEIIGKIEAVIAFSSGLLSDQNDGMRNNMNQLLQWVDANSLQAPDFDPDWRQEPASVLATLLQKALSKMDGSGMQALCYELKNNNGPIYCHPESDEHARITGLQVVMWYENKRDVSVPHLMGLQPSPSTGTRLSMLAGRASDHAVALTTVLRLLRSDREDRESLRLKVRRNEIGTLYGLEEARWDGDMMNYIEGIGAWPTEEDDGEISESEMTDYDEDETRWFVAL